METPRIPQEPQLLVACLCADWCGTCREYQPKFEQLQAQYPDVQFEWVDVEDASDVVDPVEVENFPTLLIATRERVQFFGTVMPHAETLQRLIETQRGATTTAQAQPPLIEALAKRIWE